MTDFRMPSLGADMETGTLVEWLKKPGDELRRGDVIAVVETQKGAIEIEVFETGVLDAVHVQPGDEVPVGHVLATIVTASEARAPRLGATGPQVLPGAPPSPAPPSHPPPPVSPAGTPAPAPRGAVMATPVARRTAAQFGIDLSTLKPGPDGIIGLDEVEHARVARPERAPARIDHAEMRRAIAAAMARSNRDIPHYYVGITIDLTPMMTWIAEHNASRTVDQRILYAAPLLRAVALSFREYPALNGFYEDDDFRPADQVNIGVAIARRGGGLITPAILQADMHDIDALMMKLNDLVKRVRGGGLRSSELSMGTVTLTNLGERTADWIMPIIYPPQVAIVGCGQIRLGPWVVGDNVVPRQLLEVTLAGDHRVSDGRTGTQFLARLASLLARPEEL